MKLDDLLKVYRADLQTAETPDLSKLFNTNARRTSFTWWPAAAVAAAAIVLVALAIGNRGPRPDTPEITAATSTSPAATAAIAPAAAVPAPARRAVRARVLKQSTIAGPFFALGETALLPRPAALEVVRVNLEEDRLAPYGLRPPGRSGRRVTAEVLVGDDGIARAIRVLERELE